MKSEKKSQKINFTFQPKLNDLKIIIISSIQLGTIATCLTKPKNTELFSTQQVENLKINNPNLFFFPPNSIKVRESQSTKDCIVLISKREREKSRILQLWKFPTNNLPPPNTLRERKRTSMGQEIFNPSFFDV